MKNGLLGTYPEAVMDSSHKFGLHSFAGNGLCPVPRIGTGADPYKTTQTAYLPPKADKFCQGSVFSRQKVGKMLFSVISARGGRE